MTPAEAGFDGAKGVRLRNDDPNFRYFLRRGKKNPSEFPAQDFKEQLVWLYPDGEPARLLWCNQKDEWFELSFTPIQKP